jgi:hypothetical protein
VETNQNKPATDAEQSQALQQPIAENTSPAEITAPVNIEPSTPGERNQPAETVNQNLTDPNAMEVHKHPHHVMHPKKWSEYLLEFAMLFLAVFLGFVAENFREHLIEKKHEHQYITSLYDDLKVDTAAVNIAIDQKKWVLSNLDSLQQLLALPGLPEQNEELYYLERFLTKNEMFNTQDVTFQQLKSSGSFRYISNLALYKKLSNYYSLYNHYQTLIESQFENINNLTGMESSLFNGKDLNSLNSNSPTSFYKLFKRPQTTLHPVTMDYKSLNFLTVKVGNALLFQQTCLVFLDRIKESAAALIADIEKEYQLEKE